MSVYWNERVKNISPYVPGEQPKDKKYIKLNTNENPYAASPEVNKAIQNAVDERLKLYPDPACTELRGVIAAQFNLKTSQVFAGNGSDEILAFAFAAFFEEGSNHDRFLLFPDITYTFYPVYAKLWNIPHKEISLGENFSVDINLYLDLIDQDKASGIIFSNPNAPTGMAISLKQLAKTAAALEKNNHVLIIDEAYIAFADGEGIGTAIPMINEFPNLLVIRTLSKEASLAGLRSGYALGSEELIEGLCRIKDCFNSYTMDRLALAGTAAAIKDAKYYKEINSKVIATRNRVSKELRSMGFTVLPSQANFIFAAPPEGSKSGKEFFTALRERGILVRHFNKPRIDNYLRISIGTDEDMDTFLKTCKEIL